MPSDGRFVGRISWAVPETKVTLLPVRASNPLTFRTYIL